MIKFYRDNQKKEKIESKQSICKEFLGIIGAILSNIRGILFFEDLLYSLTAFIEIFLFWNIFKRINLYILCLIIGNILIFYSPIDKYYPKFLFKIRMFIKEIIEGILCLFWTLISFSKGKK